jgi:hypothetical protein
VASTFFSEKSQETCARLFTKSPTIDRAKAERANRKPLRGFLPAVEWLQTQQ